MKTIIARWSCDNCGVETETSYNPMRDIYRVPELWKTIDFSKFQSKHVCSEKCEGEIKMSFGQALFDEGRQITDRLLVAEVE